MSATPFLFHPAADIFPLMDKERLADLMADIERNGMLMPIVLYEGKILDGRNRYMACQELEVEPAFTEWDGANPYDYVWSCNGERRDLTQAQKYLCWKLKEEKSAEWRVRVEKIHKEGDRKRSEAAKEGKVGRAAAKEALFSGGSLCSTTERDEGAIESRRATTAKAEAASVDIGTVKRMDTLATHRPDLAEKVRTGEMKPAEGIRNMKRDQVADKVQDLPKGKYRVIYADPPWQYSNSGAIADGDHYSRHEKHYPPMALSDICALNVRGLSADDAVLFLWSTSPLLEDAFKVINAWGFKYKASFVWDKMKHNFGHYNSVRHEFLLIATKGSCVPDNGKLHDSVVGIERTEHSEKPSRFREIIDEIYSNGPRIELFARGAIPANWVAWGNEAAD